MYSLFFIAKKNIQKHKAEVAILFTLVFLAALLLFSSLSLLLSADNAVKECEEKYHTSDLMVFESTAIVNNPYKPDSLKSSEEFRDVIAAVPGTKLCEMVPSIQWTADSYHGKETRDDASSNQFFVLSSGNPTYLNAFPEELENLADDEIAVPFFLSSSIKIGDEFHIIGNGLDLSFTVKGYLQHLYFATSMNITGNLILVSPHVYDEISSHISSEMVGSFVYCKVEDGVDLKEYDLAVQHAFGDDAPSTVDKDLMIMGTKSIPQIACSIILIFTIVLVGLALIIMHFSIKNFIEMNIQNIGLLQANGYTAKALRWACILEEMLICAGATVLAIFIGILLSPPLGSLQGMLMGLTGFSGVCIPALLSTLIGVPLMVFLGTLLASRSYKKLTVLESLRSGMSNHNFKKNHFALDKTSAPLELALSGKSILGRPKKSLFIVLIVALLTFSTILGFSLFENFALDQSGLLKLIGFENSDVEVYALGGEDLLEELNNCPDVERTLTTCTLSSIEVTFLDHSTTLGVETYGDLSVLENEYILEGHVPNNANEITLTQTEADILHVKIGDVVNIKAVDGSGSVAFTVSGIDQKIHNLGKVALVSEEGAKRIDPHYRFDAIMIYLKDPSQAKAFMKEWGEKYPTNNFLLVDDMIGATIDTLSSAMNAICIIFVAMTCFVVILTEILLTRSQIIRERSELGVSKAIGYTSGELIRRVVMSNLPLILLGVLVGVVMHVTLSDYFMIAGMSSFGIKQSNFSTNPLWYLLTLVLIIVCAIATSFLNARSISKLEPVRILKEE